MTKQKSEKRQSEKGRFGKKKNVEFFLEIMSGKIIF